MLHKPGAAEGAFLAWNGSGGEPALAPVCPIFSGAGVFVLAARGTPKVACLRADPRYALHAQVGADDCEFRISGVVAEVSDPGRHAAVLDDIPFPNFDPEDPLFECLIERALAVTWAAGNPSRQLFVL